MKFASYNGLSIKDTGAGPRESSRILQRTVDHGRRAGLGRQIAGLE